MVPLCYNLMMFAFLLCVERSKPTLTRPTRYDRTAGKVVCRAIEHRDPPPRLKLDPAKLSNSIIHYSEPDADPRREQSLYSSSVP